MIKISKVETFLLLINCQTLLIKAFQKSDMSFVYNLTYSFLHKGFLHGVYHIHTNRVEVFQGNPTW